VRHLGRIKVSNQLDGKEVFKRAIEGLTVVQRVNHGGHIEYTLESKKFDPVIEGVIVPLYMIEQIDTENAMFVKCK